MEQQKLLWIIFALATGFLVIVAAAFILFVPPGDTSLADQQTAAVDNESFDVTDYLKNSDTPLAMEKDSQPADGDTSFVIGVKDGTETAPAAEPEVKAPAAKEVTPEATAPAPKPAAPEPKPAAAVPAKPAPVKKVRVTEYWIQAGSFTRRSSAEEARQSLQQKEFDSVIFTKNVNGTEYFRVRIGPYKYKAEAEKFLSYVKNINSFENSQIYEVYVEKTL